MLTLFLSRVKYLTKLLGYIVDYFTWLCKMRSKNTGEQNETDFKRALCGYRNA